MKSREGTVVDADDLRTVLCHLYIKQKCEWIVMNNQINYSLLCRGVAFEDQMYRAAVLAQHRVGVGQAARPGCAHDAVDAAVAAGSTSSSSTFAEQSTPGMPAPGCVPAPTR